MMRSTTSVDSDGLTRRGLLAGAADASLAGVIAASAHTMPVASAATASGSGSFDKVNWPRVSRPYTLHRIVLWDAAELSVAIRRRLVSCVEVMTAYLDHIDRVNPSVNAIVNLRPRSELLAEAAEKDSLLQSGDYQGWMHGFPQAAKDLANIAGIKTTFGFFRPPFDLPPATTSPSRSGRACSARCARSGSKWSSRCGIPRQSWGKRHESS
jgi:amidase